MKERNAMLLMALASFLWGITFVFQSEAASVIGPLMYNGLRFILGFVVLLPFTIKILKRHKDDKDYMNQLIKGGLATGFFIASASFTQQAGIAYTTVGKAGFLTSLYTLFVPVFSIFKGKKVSKRLWLCVLIGVVGAFLMSMNAQSGISKGDLLMFACAILFAFQIMTIDSYGSKLEGIDLSAFQFLFGGIMSLICGLFFEPFEFSMVKNAIVPILYAGIFSCGVAYTLQIIGQKYVQPTKATLVLSLENAWAAIGGVVILHETMSLKEFLGCLMLFAAVIVSQLPQKNLN